MKLSIRIVDAPDAYGGKALMLCDESGVFLPCQVSTRLEHQAGDVAKLTVEFMVDGDLIKMV